MNLELERIKHLPVKVQCDVDVTSWLVRGDGQLRSVQSRALVEAWIAGGLVGVLGVGLGKTLIWCLLPYVMGAKRALIIVPSSVFKQSMRMAKEYSEQWCVIPFYVMTYNKLSRQQGEEDLRSLQPDLIVADEAHYLRDVMTARTQRIRRYIRDFPQTRFVALSGTMTKRSILDYAHLSEWALRGNTPLPRERWVLNTLSRVIDPEESPLPTDWSLVGQLFTLGSIESIREAFRERFSGTLGVVVSSGEMGVDASLRIIVHRQQVAIINNTQQQIMTNGQNPDGQYFVSDVEQWRCLYQTSLGWYYRAVWDGEPDEEWLEARNNWAREARCEIARAGREGYDTLGLIAKAVDADVVAIPYSVVTAWKEWCEIRDRSKGPRPVPVWFTYDVLNYYVQMFSDEVVIFWYQHDAVASALERLGVHVIRSGEEPPFDGKSSIALSRSGHSEGLNMQKWNKSVVLEPPANGQASEQLIGRTHRSTQEADTVYVHTLAHTPVFRAALKKSKRDSLYYTQTQGVPTRLTYADYSEVK